MADWYVLSSASGTGTGASWTNAKTTLAAAATASAAGDRFFVADTSAETQASAMTISFPGTKSSPNYIYCVDHTQASPGTGDYKTTATVTTTGASAMTITGYAFIYGITFSCGTTSSTTTFAIGGGVSSSLIFEACVLKLAGTGASSITIGGTSTAVPMKIEFKNTSMNFGATSQTVFVRSGDIYWHDTPSSIGGSVPTTLFGSSSPVGGFIRIAGNDLSAAGSGNTLVGAIPAAQMYVFEDSKLGASVTVAATPSTQGGARVDVIRCDSGSGNLRHERYRYQGTQTVETTNIRTGGASDGTTSYSWKIVSTANALWAFPFESMPIPKWNDTTGSPISVTVEVMNTIGSLNTDDVWFEVAYPGSSTSPQRAVLTTTKANNLATGSALTTSTATWPTGTAQKFTATFTPLMKGLIYIRVMVGKPSVTIYVDPELG